MKVFRNISFLIWCYRFLKSIGPLKKNIKKFREEENQELERLEIRKAEDAFADALIEKFEIDIRVRHAEALPEGPVVFVSNHQSYWDIPAFFASIRGKQFGFVAKESLGKIPIFGSWIADIRSVFIKREDGRAALMAINEGVKLLEKGYSLVIFPEGTRSKSSEMGEFKKGSLRLATKAKVPIVPVTLDGTYRAYEEKGHVRPAKMDFIVHKPIETKDLSRKEASVLGVEVERIIRDGLREII